MNRIIYILSMVFFASSVINNAEAAGVAKKTTKQYEGEYSFSSSVDDDSVSIQTGAQSLRSKLKIYKQQVSSFSKIRKNLKKMLPKTKSMKLATDQSKLKAIYNNISKDYTYFAKLYKNDLKRIKSKQKPLTLIELKKQMENLHTAVVGHQNSGLLNELCNSSEAKVKVAAENAYKQLSALASTAESALQESFSGQEENI